MLPPAHIQARAVRKAEQLFLSHLHHVMYVVKYGRAYLLNLISLLKKVDMLTWLMYLILNLLKATLNKGWVAFPSP